MPEDVSRQPAEAAAEQPALSNPDTASFEQIVADAERLGANYGKPEVLRLYRSWIAAHSNGDRHLYAAWFNLAVELGRAGKPDEAILAYKSGLAIKPDFSPAALNLGLQLEQCGQPAAALQVWRQATQSDEVRTALLNQRARLLEQLGQLAEAEQTLRASLLTNPQQPDAIQHWVHIRQKMCLWPTLAEIVPTLSTQDLLDQSGPLAVLALTDKVAVQRQVTAGWINRKTTPTPIRLSPPEGYQHDRIRLGYMSSDFCRHAMSYLIAELFERHDRTRFSVFGYCSSPEDGSDIRARVIRAFDRHVSIRGLTDEEAAKLIRADEVDILIDLNGLTAGARMQILRWRPAPIQATYLGFIGPVPVPELDFLCCDDDVIPPDIASAYAPRPLYIAHNYQANDTKRVIGAPTTRAAVGLPEEAFVFCCFSNHYKITEELFAAWMTILRRVERGVLWLAVDNPWSPPNLQQRAQALGVDPARLLFVGRTDPAQYMSRLALPDLFLDTYPYNAGTIASDVIRMGLPMLTLRGEAYASRMAARLLHAIGAERGVTASIDEYVETAVTLATDTAAYAQYRSLFTPARWAETIGNIADFTRQFEATLGRIHAELHRNAD